MHLRLFFAFIIMSWANALVAQSPQQWSKYGNQAIQEGDLIGATYYYKQALKADSNNLDTWMNLGKALRLSNNYLEAANVYDRVYNDPYRTKHDEALFWWASMQQNLGKYQEAAHNFKNFENYHCTRGSKIQKQANQAYKSCLWAHKHKADTNLMAVNNLGVELNSSYAEMGGTLVNDSTLIYSSLQYSKKDSSWVLSKKELSNRIQLYQAVWRDSQWVDLGPLDTNINNKNMHTANASWYPPKKWLVYSSCPDYANCKIMFTELVNGEWSDPEAFSESINLEGYNATQPYVTEIKGKLTLFFSSNRPQGKGGMDIWYSQYNERLKGFVYPRNMGRKVNSIGNEVTPYFVSDSNQLFFSSDYHNGYGGFDVFESKVLSLRSAGQPVNMGQVINSPANDLYFKSFYSDSLSILTSNREGGIKLKNQTCCNDLYYFKHEATPPPVVDSIVPEDSVETIPVLASVEELNNYLPVLYFHNDQPNPRSTKTTTKKNYLQCFKEYRNLKTQYLKEYSKHKEGAEKDSAIAKIDSFYKSKIEKGLVEFDLFMDLLFEQLKQGKSVVITIKGYASPLAKSDYNINLTQRRIQSLINYLYVYKDGELKPYLDHTAQNGGKIDFVKIPYGDSKASNNTSDNLNDKTNSVFSPQAMEERRIEILHVEGE